MSVSLLPGQIFSDMLCCLGLGLLTAALHDALTLPVGQFWRDIAAFALAAVLLQGFAAARSVSGIPRGYMAAAMLAGAAGYTWVAAPVTAALRRWAWWIITRPFCLIFIPLSFLAHFLWGRLKARAAKGIKIVKKRSKNKLKKTGRVLYNSNI